MAAAQRGGRELAAILLRAGAGGRGETLALKLHRRRCTYAAQHGATDTIESLLGAGAAVDAARADGRTALLAACQNGHAAAGIQLLAAGADATAACGEHTALHLASDGYASADAVSMGALVLALLKAKAPIEAKARGATPLARAAQLGATEVARALVAGGAVVDAVDEDLYMRDPLACTSSSCAGSTTAPRRTRAACPIAAFFDTPPAASATSTGEGAERSLDEEHGAPAVRRCRGEGPRRLQRRHYRSSSGRRRARARTTRTTKSNADDASSGDETSDSDSVEGQRGGDERSRVPRTSSGRGGGGGGGRCGERRRRRRRHVEDGRGERRSRRLGARIARRRFVCRVGRSDDRRGGGARARGRPQSDSEEEEEEEASEDEGEGRRSKSSARGGGANDGGGGGRRRREWFVPAEPPRATARGPWPTTSAFSTRSRADTPTTPTWCARS